jgi:two-component system nitrogen regulation sensor histidine kinase NtrY
MTTREKGTGLGLAIVRKVMEDHEGSISLHDAAAVASGGRGARVRLEFTKPVEGFRAEDEKDGVPSEVV